MSSSFHVVREGVCYEMHRVSPASVPCLASWMSLVQGLVCCFQFFHMLKKINKAHKRALAGYAKNAINITSHSHAFYGCIVYYVFWGIGCIFDLNREYKYRVLSSPGLQGEDVRELAPLIIGSTICRSFTNFLESYIVVLLISDSIGKDTFRRAMLISIFLTLFYVPSILVVVIWYPGYTSIYWPLQNLAILYLVRDAITVSYHFAALIYIRGKKTFDSENGIVRYLKFMCVIYVLYIIFRICYLTSSIDAVNFGICGDDFLHFAQYGLFGPLCYLALKRDCQYWATDLENETELTHLSNEESLAWSEINDKSDSIIPKTEIYKRNVIEERCDVSVEVHFWRRRQVVVKRFKLDLLTRDNIRYFKEEAAVFKTLHHQNVIAFYGILVDPPSLGIVMQYASKGDLFKYLEQRLVQFKDAQEDEEAMGVGIAGHDGGSAAQMNPLTAAAAAATASHIIDVHDRDSKGPALVSIEMRAPIRSRASRASTAPSLSYPSLGSNTDDSGPDGSTGVEHFRRIDEENENENEDEGEVGVKRASAKKKPDFIPPAPATPVTPASAYPALSPLTPPSSGLGPTRLTLSSSSSSNLPPPPPSASSSPSTPSSFMSRLTRTSFFPGSPASPQTFDPNKIRDFHSINCALQIAKGMAYLHSKDVCHRDLKSLNILLDNNHNAMIADFGESKFEEDITFRDSVANSNIGGPVLGVLDKVRKQVSRGVRGLTGLYSDDEDEDEDAGSSKRASYSHHHHHKGEIGTPGWAAPECMEGNKASKSSDVFSYGIILWELVTWIHPSVHVSVSELLEEPLRSMPGISDLLHPESSSYNRQSLKRVIGNVFTQSRGSRSLSTLGEDAERQIAQLNPMKLILIDACEAERAKRLLLHQKRRPPIPAGCPPVLAIIMRRCWDSDQDKRPTFPDVVSELVKTMQEELPEFPMAP